MSWGLGKISTNSIRGSSGNKAISSSLRQGRSRPNRTWERLAWIVGMILIIVMLIDLVSKEISIRSLQKQIETTQKAIVESRIEYERLLQRREFMQGDAFVEREARGNLRLLRPGDLFFVVP